jgi:hypothetical protein
MFSDIYIITLHEMGLIYYMQYKIAMYHLAHDLDNN